MAAQMRWQLVRDESAGADARDVAWRSLCARVRQPVLFQLRRRIEGWRLTEELADEVCDRVFRTHASDRLRDCVETEVAAVCEERDAAPEIDDDFERDWASSLAAAALKELKRVDPDAHRLLLRLYDRPEEGRPLTAAELAAKLQVPVTEVDQALTAARTLLRRLFETEVRHTVADQQLAAHEFERLLPRAKALFG